LHATAKALISTPFTGYPRFIVQVYPPPNSVRSTVSYISFVIWEADIWELGDTWDDVENRIRHQTTLTIDGKIIVRGRNELILSSLMLWSLPEPGTLVASYGNFDSLSMEVDLPAGLHVVTVKVASKNGSPHVFTWAFRIE
jgi:hypothetical protein